MLTPQFFDVHTHTHFAAFEGESEEVIKRSLDKNVWIINVGTQRDTSLGAVETARKYDEGVYATVGLHPIHTEKSYHDAKELGKPLLEVRPLAGPSGGPALAESGFMSRAENFDYEYYKKLAEDPKTLAIGECGLDYYRLGEETKIRQFEAFEKQISLAQEVAKPLMIHCRDAFADLISILNAKRFTLNARGAPGVVHFFTGTVDDAHALLELGFSFSFGGVITFTSDYNEQLQYIPLERIVSETDAPYVSPVPYRGKRNEPMYVLEVAQRISEIKGIEYEKVRSQLVENALNIFDLKNS